MGEFAGYPPHYHAVCAALIRGDDAKTRVLLARSLRLYRKAGNRQAARNLRDHAYWVGYPRKRV